MLHLHYKDGLNEYDSMNAVFEKYPDILEPVFNGVFTWLEGFLGEKSFSQHLPEIIEKYVEDTLALKTRCAAQKLIIRRTSEAYKKAERARRKFVESWEETEPQSIMMTNIYNYDLKYADKDRSTINDEKWAEDQIKEQGGKIGKRS